MKIVIPISSHDLPLLPDFLSVLEKFGGLQQHHISLIPQPAQLVEAHEASARLAQLTPNVEVLCMGENLPPNAWPTSCNLQFFFAAQQMSTRRMPWLWMELDTLPVKEDWANALAYEYSSKGALFLGNISSESDGMMTGVAVYHPDTIHEPLMGDLRRGCTEPFDYYLRWAWKRHGYANSEVLCDMWNTVNYRREGNSIVCDAGPAREMGPGMIGRKRAGGIPTAASIVHGCKDGSLARLLLGAVRPAQVTAPTAPTLRQDEPPQKTLAEMAVDAWWRGLLVEEKQRLQDHHTNPKQAKDNSWLDDLGPDTPLQAAPKTQDKEIQDWLNSTLSKGNLRIKAFNDQWKMGTEAAKSWIVQNGYTLSGPGWIKKARKK